MKKLKKDHKLKSSTRTIPLSLCDEPKCKFYGKPAAQGICSYPLSDATDKYVSIVLKSGEDFLKEVKALRYENKASSQKKWINYLENQIICIWAHSDFVMDELIHLRAENAKLQVQLGKWKGR